MIRRFVREQGTMNALVSCGSLEMLDIVRHGIPFEACIDFSYKGVNST